MKTLHMLYQYWRNVLVLLFHHAVYTEKQEEPKVKQKKKKTRELPKVEYEDIAGQYKTIGKLLNDLEKVFKDLNKLKPKVNWAQGMIKKYGAYIYTLNLEDHDETDGFRADILEDINSYGTPAMLINYQRGHSLSKEESEKFLPSFFIASKRTKPNLFSAQPGFVYYECIWSLVMNRTDKKYTRMKDDIYHAGFEVSVDRETGVVDAIPSMQHIPHILAIGKNKGQGYCENKLGYPDFRSTEQFKEHADIRQDLVIRFCLEYNMTMRREHGINIYVKKGKDKAVFSVPQNRWKYFFKDRIDAIAADGKKKRIFHAVIAHHRILSSGKQTNVRTHYRGSRNFMWNGYQIHIVIQGKHGMAAAEFGLTSYEGKGGVSITDDDVVKKITGLLENGHP